MNIGENLITRQHLMSILEVKSRTTILKWEKQGMPVVRIGGLKRYDIAKVMAWFSDQDNKGFK